MWKNLIETSTSNRLERELDYAARRSELLLQNVANANTPGYKRIDLDFDAILKQTMTRTTPGLPLALTDSKHLPGTVVTEVEPPVVHDDSTSMRLDGNNVDVEYEMARIAENSMYYQALSNSWKSNMNRTKLVIEGRA